MKSKKRHHTSSEEESEESDGSQKTNTSSDSESDDSSMSEQRHKKKRKRADSSEYDSDSDDQKRSKKRKHKKKKKKHGKKKRRTESAEDSDSAEELSSVSEGEISSKKKRKHKHKHKHSKRARTSSVSQQEESQGERRLHSVVKERRGSSVESQPSRTYYQKEYRRSGSGQEEYEREREVQRFYRGSSKERRHQYQENYQYERGNNDRYAPRQEKYDRNREKFAHNAQYNHPNEEYVRRQRDYEEYKRHHRYEERRQPDEEFHRKPKEVPYHVREDARGHNRYNQFEPIKRREYDDGARDYRERRGGPPEGERYREREYPEKKEKYREEAQTSDRVREDHRERVQRTERPPPPPVPRERPKSRSPGERYREKNRKEDREELYREGRDERRDGREGRREGREERGDGREERRDGREEKRDVREEKRDGRDERRERPARTDDRREGRVVVKTEPGTRDRKSRFETEDKQYAWGKEVKKEGDKQGEKEKPNFGLSGKLTADANTVNGVVIKYTEPDDAKQPKRRWRFYPFKGDKPLPILYIHRQSYFLIGRDKKVVDIILEHPSISKQHAALQYRATPFTRTDGSQGRRVRPYVIDLESANGTFVNNKKIEPRRYIELLERDVVKFGFSQREYVLLHENSKDDAMDDDNNEVPDVGGNITTTHQLKQEKRIKEEITADGD